MHDKIRRAIENANKNGFTINLSANTLAHADALADLLIPAVAGRRVLLARASRGRDVLPKRLQAAGVLDRALAVSRRADGLFNQQQIPLLKLAADSRYAISDFGGAERDYMYALKIAEQNHGYGDPRTIPPLLELGTFYEGLSEFIAARMMYMRARDAALQAKPGYSPEVVKALTGIARCHRLQFTMAPDTLESQQPARDEVTGEMVGKVYKESRVPPAAADRTGLKAVQQALDLMRATPEPPPELMTRALIELGDWFQSTSRPAMSMPYYAEAAAILDVQSAADPLLGHPLRAPRMVFYRPPVSASRGLNTLSGRYIIRKTVFSFLVAEDGVPRDITVVSTNMNEDQVGLSLLWTLYAAAALAWGFLRSNPAVRYAALALFGLTVFKVFAVDLGAVRTAYRILSFLVLGVVLLLVSLAYQKRRR